MLEKDIDDLVNDTQVLMALKAADHFIITHYCKKREQIEFRRCYWDENRKVWQKKRQDCDYLLSYGSRGNRNSWLQNFHRYI